MPDLPEASSARDEMLQHALDKLLAEISSLETKNVSAMTCPDQDGAVDILVTQDRLKVFVDLYPPLGQGLPVVEDALKERLISMGLTGILENNLREAVERCAATKTSQRRVLVAQGLAPQEPQEGRLRVLFPLERPGHSGLQEDEHGRVDFKDRGAIYTANPGDMLVIFDPPVPGIPGHDVYAQEIPVRQPKAVTIRAGQGVETPDGRRFLATEKGQPFFLQGTIAIKPVIVISGDVDYASGNVEFDGSVVIQGHVREGFSVTAGRDLEVGGSVEAAHLRAGRNIVVRGGVVGEHSTVDAGGHVTLRFLEAGTATADGDVLVASHLLHAKVMSCGTVVVQGKKGILGGTVVARNRIETLSAGTIMGTSTALVVGIDFRARFQLEEVREKIRGLDAMASRIAETIKGTSLRYLQGGRPVIPKDIADRIETLLGHYQRTTAEAETLRVQEKALQARDDFGARQEGRIQVRNRVFPGVSVEVRGTRREIQEELRFVSFSLDPDSGQIHLGPA